MSKRIKFLSELEFEEGAVVAEVEFVQRQVMDGHASGDVQPVPFGAGEGGQRTGRGDLVGVIARAGHFDQRQIAVQRHALGHRRDGGQTAQPLHRDDGHYLAPRPRPPFVVSCIWALDDFTAAIIAAFWYLRNEELEREQEAVKRDTEVVQQQIRMRLVENQEQLLRLARVHDGASTGHAELQRREPVGTGDVRGHDLVDGRGGGEVVGAREVEQRERERL